MNRTFRIDPKTFCIGFPGDCFPLCESCETQPNCGTLFTIATAFLSSLSFVGIVAFLWLFVWLFINLVMRETCTYPRFCIPFQFCRIDTREDANSHKAIACTYLSNSICTVFEEWRCGYFCLGYFFPSTHFDLVTFLAQKVWRLLVLVFAHDRHSHAGNCNGLLANTGLSTGKRYLSLSILDHCSCFNSVCLVTKVSALRRWL